MPTSISPISISARVEREDVRRRGSPLAEAPVGGLAGMSPSILSPTFFFANYSSFSKLTAPFAFAQERFSRDSPAATRSRMIKTRFIVAIQTEERGLAGQQSGRGNGKAEWQLEIDLPFFYKRSLAVALAGPRKKKKKIHSFSTLSLLLFRFFRNCAILELLLPLELIFLFAALLQS